jgi:dephospho-CoA kinase
VGRGHASRLTNLDTWHSETFTDIWHLLIYYQQVGGPAAAAAAVGRPAMQARVQTRGMVGQQTEVQKLGAKVCPGAWARATVGRLRHSARSTVTMRRASTDMVWDQELLVECLNENVESTVLILNVQAAAPAARAKPKTSPAEPHRRGTTAAQVRRKKSAKLAQKLGQLQAFYSCVPAGMHCVVCADLKPLSLKAPVR